MQVNKTNTSQIKQKSYESLECIDIHCSKFLNCKIFKMYLKPINNKTMQNRYAKTYSCLEIH